MVVAEQAVAGTIHIADDVIEAIVGVAVQGITGVTSMGDKSFHRTLVERVSGKETMGRGIAVEAGQREVIVDIDINVAYACSMPDLATEIRNEVFSQLKKYTGLIAKEINVHIVGIDFSNKSAGLVE